MGFDTRGGGLYRGSRANRFVESVFTAPVERRDWLIAKILALLTFAAADHAGAVSDGAGICRSCGAAISVGHISPWTPGILLAGIAIGTLIGVLFIGRSVAAPAATGMGVLLHAWDWCRYRN